MNRWSTASLVQRSTCHIDLQRLADRVLEFTDCKFHEGRRSVEQQTLNVAKGVSWTMNSKHVTGDLPSLAMDLSYWPMDWTDTTEDAIRKHYWFAGVVQATAREMGIKIRWGGDWDSDHDLREEKRRDLVHFELVI